MPPLLALLIVAALAFLHFKRHYAVERLSGDSLDFLQSSRYFARTGQFGTLVVRPLVSGFMPFRADGSQPDLGHAPLYTIVTGTAMRLRHQTGANAGDQPAVLVTLAAWTGSVIAVFLLARRLFVTNTLATLAAVLYAFSSGTGLLLALTPHPATLAALLFPLLFLALALLDKRANEPEISLRAAGFWAIIAGVLYGLLFLSVYSTLILLPIFAGYMGLVSGRKRGFVTIPVFLLAFFLVISPYLWRNYKQAHNPFFHSRSLELIMQTETNPGYELYRSATLSQSVGQYLTSGGYKQILKKSFVNIVSYMERLPATFGIILFPLYIGAGLIRFDDSRTNRLRTLAYLCLVVQFMGLSLFQTATENIPLLLMHTAVAAVFAAGFLFSLVRARNLPRFYANVTLWGWTTVTCLPGLLIYLSGETTALPQPWGVFASVNDPKKANSVRLAPVLAGQALLVSESPWEWAFRCNLPTVWIPRDAGDVRTVEERAGRPIAAFVLTPTLLSDYQGDSAAGSWQVTYLRLGALWSISEPLDASLRRTLIGKVKLYYPPDISPAIASFQPEPFSEHQGRQYTFFFWNPSLTEATSK